MTVALFRKGGGLLPPSPSKVSDGHRPPLQRVVARRPRGARPKSTYHRQHLNRLLGPSTSLRMTAGRNSQTLAGAKETFLLVSKPELGHEEESSRVPILSYVTSTL